MNAPAQRRAHATQYTPHTSTHNRCHVGEQQSPHQPNMLKHRVLPGVIAEIGCQHLSGGIKENPDSAHHPCQMHDTARHRVHCRQAMLLNGDHSSGQGVQGKCGCLTGAAIW